MDNQPENPERVLSAALRAQAAGGGQREQPSAPAPTPTGKPGKTARPRLPIASALVFALLLGLAAGAILAFLSLP